MKFYADFAFMSYRCPDGCCSDYWYDLEIWKDGEKIYSTEDIRFIHSQEAAEEYAREILKDDLVGDYELVVEYA